MDPSGSKWGMEYHGISWNQMFMDGYKNYKMTQDDHVAEKFRDIQMS
jgi:hypothetical protein